jgi:hypothetical protein
MIQLTVYLEGQIIPLGLAHIYLSGKREPTRSSNAANMIDDVTIN